MTKKTAGRSKNSTRFWFRILDLLQTGKRAFMLKYNVQPPDGSNVVPEVKRRLFSTNRCERDIRPCPSCINNITTIVVNCVKNAVLCTDYLWVVFARLCFLYNNGCRVWDSMAVIVRTGFSDLPGGKLVFLTVVKTNTRLDCSLQGLGSDTPAIYSLQ